MGEPATIQTIKQTQIASIRDIHGTYHNYDDEDDDYLYQTNYDPTWDDSWFENTGQDPWFDDNPGTMKNEKNNFFFNIFF